MPAKGTAMGATASRRNDLFVYPTFTSREVEHYREQGYVHLGRILTADGLKQIRDQVMRAWAARKGAFNPEESWLRNSLLPDIHHLSDLVRSYYFHGPMVDIAVQLIGPNIKAVTSQLTFKMRGNTMPFAWHQDNVYGELDPYNAISCLTALDDADVENGCLRLIPGSHKDGQANYQHTNEDRGARRPVEMEVDDSRGIPLPMKAGECLFFHCHMLHHSEGNRAKDRDRRLMLFRYADADAVEVYNDRRPRLGRLLRGRTLFPEVEAFEANLPLDG